MLLKGYFQCERFFSDQRDAVYALFYNHDHTIRLKNKYKNILRSSISLHVRRGDYLAIPRYHPVPTADYYFTAIEKIKKTAKVDNILIFSDDHHWCEKTFNGHQFTFVKGLKDFEDLILMGLCDNHIIANSSFSWWGSWLGRNPNKIIIAPRIWVGPDAGRDWSDIYTDKMLIL